MIFLFLPGQLVAQVANAVFQSFRFAFQTLDGFVGLPSFVGELALFFGLGGFALLEQPPVFFPLFGLLFIAFGVGGAIWQFNRAQAYQRAEENYKRRRRALLDRLGNPFRRDNPDEY